LEKSSTTNKVVDSKEKVDENHQENKTLSEKNTVSYEEYEDIQRN
jgi:hypothetical protein